MADLDELKIELATAECKLKRAQDAQKMDGSLVVIEDCPRHGGFKKIIKELEIIPGKKIRSCSECPHCAAMRVESLKSQIKLIKSNEIKALKDVSGIPPRFKDCSFDNYLPTNDGAKRALSYAARYAEKWLDRFSRGGGLVFCGKPGTGKNHLACAIANSVIEQHQAKAMISTALRIARDVKSSWGSGGKSEAQALKNYTDKDLLIIDEIGVQFGSDAEKIILFEIINTRYEQMKPTILISNLSAPELANYIGERVLDRMMEGQGAIVAFDWDSYRK